MRIKYAIKYNGEYMKEKYGSDCFTDDLAHAILFDSIELAEKTLMIQESIAIIICDDEGSMYEQEAKGGLILL